MLLVVWSVSFLVFTGSHYLTVLKPLADRVARALIANGPVAQRGHGYASLLSMFYLRVIFI